VDSHKISVAPMLDCTDSHFRRLVRLLSRRVHLWTEMVNQDAVIHAHATRPSLLSHGDEEHPLTVQLGGSSPGRLARASEICVDEYGYDEVNLNCGCPSAKVVNKPDLEKRFGAALMKDAELVGECLRRVKEAVDVPVTVKHRLGVRTSYRLEASDSTGWSEKNHLHDSYDFVSEFVDAVSSLSGVDHFIVHARCAVLGGLSTTANRSVPPLRYHEVHALADDFPRLGFSINGGVETIEDAASHLRSGKLRGVMMGRAVYRNPAILADVDWKVYGDDGGSQTRERVPGERAAPLDVVARWPEDGWRENAARRGRDSFFRIGGDGGGGGVSRLDVLRRFSRYGDAVLALRLEDLREHPKGLGEPRGLAKAMGGMCHGVRAGGGFKNALEKGLQGWTETLLSTSDVASAAASLSFSELVEACVVGLGEAGVEDMQTPICDPLESERRRRRNEARGDGGGDGGGDEPSRDAES